MKRRLAAVVALITSTLLLAPPANACEPWEPDCGIVNPGPAGDDGWYGPSDWYYGGYYSPGWYGGHYWGGGRWYHHWY